MLLRRNLTYYARQNLGVILGAALCTMVLAGALHVGDSVRASLQQLAKNRVGKADSMLFTEDRYFRAALADEFQESLKATVAPVFMLRGTVSNPNADEDAGQISRVANIQILGVDQRFFDLAPESAELPLEDGQVFINPNLASRMKIEEGAILNLRLEEPAQFSRDAPLSGTSDKVTRISRQKVAKVLKPSQFANFSLHASQIPPYTLILPIDTLRAELENQKNQANLLLVGKSKLADYSTDKANDVLEKSWTPEDATIQTLELPGNTQWSIRSASLFISESIEQGIRQLDSENDSGVLTYLVNNFEGNAKAAPYSFATAYEPGASPDLPADLSEEQVVINQWLADNLGLQVGSELTLKYFVTTGRRQLKENQETFKVHSILPMPEKLEKGEKSPWTPDFPGLSDQENCRDWQPGFSIDETQIDDEDELYWDEYRGTPKAFITLSAGQKLWGNRWGQTTGIRIPKSTYPDQASLHAAIQQNLTASQAGLHFQPLRQKALDATNGPIDFGQLFAGFSFFIIIAALALTAMLFVFSVEQRNQQAGLLLAVGHTPQSIRRRLLLEGMILAAIGTIPGAILGLLYAKAMLWGLTHVWTDATGSMSFTFTLLPVTVTTGILSGLLMATFALWLAIRKQLRHEPRELLHAGDQLELSDSKRPKHAAGKYSQILSALFFVGALIYLAFNGNSNEAFFLAGFLLLFSALFFFNFRLARIPLHAGDIPNLTLLGFRNTARRKGRSLVTIGILASGTYLVVAVSSFHLDAFKQATEKNSGTGGFTLIANSAIAIYDDLNTEKGQDEFGLDADKLAESKIVPMRVRQGEDASCLNLNQATNPTLLGITPSELTGRFTFASAAGKPIDPWGLLEKDSENNTIPGIADQNTAMYALGKGMGDLIEYTDENGETFNIRLVGLLKNSLLQGQILISEENFIQKFPNQAGYRQFLIDTPAEQTEPLSVHLSNVLRDQGFEANSAAERLQQFLAVQNTYLAIFQALGGLGLLLGSAGLAIVVARNLLERRKEFSILEAIGYSLGDLRKLAIGEHRWLLIWGLLSGALSALIAVWPAIKTRQEGFPLQALGLLLLALAILSWFWIFLATRLSLKESTLPALREE